MIDTYVEEEILLESSHVSLEEDLLDHDSIDLRFKQQIPSKAYHANYLIVNGSQLHTSIRTFRKRTQFQFNLAYLNLTPITKRHISWFWYHAMALFTPLFLVSLILTAGNMFPGGERLGIWITAHAVTLAIISLLMLLLRSYHREVFCSRHGGVPILELAPHLPNRQAYQVFLLDLKDRALSAQGHANRMYDTALAGELREHRRLRDEGIIDDATYDAAKAHIMKSH